MIQKVINTIEKNSMFIKGDRVIVAVSGGPDSIVLLHLLIKLRERLGISIMVGHVNHCLRGTEADEDEQFVHTFCKLYNIECYSKRIDILRLAEINNISSETAGREARYGFLDELKNSLHADKIALAHNANDQAETVLMRIMRGTGIEGLVGIKPVRDDIFVRPLINVSRGEIEEYCKINKISPRIDKTNFENIYTRNKIRLELIPYIQENFNQDIINGIIKLSDTAQKDNCYIEKQVDLRYKKYCNRKDGMVIINSEAFIEDEAILARLIRRALFDISGKLHNFEKAHIYAIINIQKQGTNKEAILPNGIFAFNDYGNIILSRNKMSEDKGRYSFLLNIGKENEIKHFGMTATLNILNRKDIIFTDKPRVKYFDYDKINGDIVIRNRIDGDKFIPLGMVGSKKLKDLFIDLKVKKAERNNVPLICFGDDIAWVVGYRISEKYKINSNTENILQIKLESEC